jgi:hypothetical protein
MSSIPLVIKNTPLRPGFDESRVGNIHSPVPADFGAATPKKCAPKGKIQQLRRVSSGSFSPSRCSGRQQDARKLTGIPCAEETMWLDQRISVLLPQPSCRVELVRS